MRQVCSSFVFVAAAAVAALIGASCSDAVSPNPAAGDGGTDPFDGAPQVAPSSGAGSGFDASSGGSGNGSGTGSGASGGAGYSGASGAIGGSSGSSPSGTNQDSGTANAGSPPDSSTTVDAGPFDQFQMHNLATLNGYRTQAGLPPYVLDEQLSAFALAGSQELTMDHLPHQHFRTAMIFAPGTGFKNSAGENQGDPNGWKVMSQDPTANETMQIDDILAKMYAEGPGPANDPAHGHYNNIMSTKFTRVGVGLIEVGGHLYLTNDFSN